MWFHYVCITAILLLRAQGETSGTDDVMEKIESMQRTLAGLEKQHAEELVAMETKLESKILDLSNKLTAQDSTSFFSAQLSEDTEVLHGSNVVFDSVRANYGDDYIQSGGLYIAPQDGHYMFTLVVREVGDQHSAGTVMRTPGSDPNNPVMMCRAEQGHEAYNTGTCTVIMQLLAGDQISVIADGFDADVEDSVFMADGYTSFTGLMVRAGLE